MLFGIIGLVVLYAGLERLNNLKKKEEIKKAAEGGYEVYFNY